MTSLCDTPMFVDHSFLLIRSIIQRPQSLCITSLPRECCRKGLERSGIKLNQLRLGFLQKHPFGDRLIDAGLACVNVTGV